MQDCRKVSRRQVLLGGIAVGASFAAPGILRAQTKSQPIRVGMATVLHGTAAMLGASSRQGAKMRMDEINAAGGIAGRQLELIVRDTRAQPQEAARVVRELVNTDGCDVIIAADPNSLAIQEVVRDLKALCFYSTSETTSYTADPKLRVPTSFRTCRQGIHDSILGGAYAASVAKKDGIRTWASISPDYSYGRETTEQFFRWLKHFHPEVEIKAQVWPRLGTPDFADLITRILQARPNALYSALWGGDLGAFVGQGSVYGLFSQTKMFSVNLADYNVLASIKSLPPGIHSGARYLDTFPATAANKAWADKYRAEFKQQPTVWSTGNYLAMQFLQEGARKAGSADSAQIAAALAEGLTIDSVFGQKGTITMRPGDQTIVDYAAGWGITIPKEPYVIDIVPADWGMILELEAQWKAEQGFN